MPQASSAEDAAAVASVVQEMMVRTAKRKQRAVRGDTAGALTRRLLQRHGLVVPELGQFDFDPAQLIAVERLVERSRDTGAAAARALLGFLQDASAVQRLRAMLLLQRLVPMSASLRRELDAKFQTVVKYAIAPTGAPLPKPKPVAAQLRSVALECVDVWYVSMPRLRRALGVAYGDVGHRPGAANTDTSAPPWPARTRT